MTKNLLIVKGDTNDGDYITKQTDVTKSLDARLSANYTLEDDSRKETLRQFLLRVSEAIKYRKKEWPASEHRDESVAEVYEGILSLEDIEIFEEFTPHGEDGIHTIESIHLLTVAEDKKLV